MGIAVVDKSGPYVPGVFIQKEECVNHVAKQIASNLRRLLKKHKGKKLQDGK